MERMDSLPQPAEHDLQAPVNEQNPEIESDLEGKSLFRELIETILLAIVIFLVVNGTTGRFRIEGSRIVAMSFCEPRSW